MVDDSFLVKAPKTSRFKPLGVRAPKKSFRQREVKPPKGRRFIRVKDNAIKVDSEARDRQRRRERLAAYVGLESQQALKDIADEFHLDVDRVAEVLGPQALDYLASASSALGPQRQRDAMRSMVQEYFRRRRNLPTLTVQSIIIPEKKTTEGVLIKSASVVWATYVEMLRKNWKLAYEIPPHLWEELVAGAYKQAGFDNVTLTPRSGDYGRDVIAEKHGVGCIKILGSVKAYKPGHLVKHDDVRALLGVLSGERDASKGIITTTSDFAPKIVTDPYIAPFMPYRLELMNGDQLSEWLISLLDAKLPRR
jgi:restriction system protein